MPKILALDASTEVCSVAVGDGTQIASRFCSTPKSHSKVLLPLVDEVLTEANLKLTELDAIAVSRGPGSFTGIRIGMGVVQGLSYGANLPIIGLSTLEVMAQSYLEACDSSEVDWVVPCLDARMAEVYSSGYRKTAEGWQATIAAAVASPSEFVSVLSSSLGVSSQQKINIAGIGHGWAVAPLDELDLAHRDCELKPQATALYTLARETFERAKQSKTGDHNDKIFPVAAVEPVYLRNEITWKKRQRIRQ